MGKATVEMAGIDKSKKAGASLSDKGGDDE
jgi:hypothetical protein